MEPICLPTLDPEHQPHVYSGKFLKDAPVVQRILFRLVLEGVDITNGEICWPWPGSVNKAGYGRIGSDPGGETYVHRVMFRECIGPIPEGHDVEHSCHSQDPTCLAGDACRHRRCANPRHFDAVTHAENLRLRRLDERQAPCANGPHPWVRGSTKACRTCSNAYQWAMKRGFRGTFAELWASPLGADYLAARRVQ